MDFLGLDDFSSPYQDEEVIGQTPTLAQLNSEDSLPVCEALCPPVDLTLPALQPQPPKLSSHNKRCPVPGHGSSPSAVRPSPGTTSSSQSRPSRSLLPDFPEGSQRATRPIPSSTETMAKTQNLLGVGQEHGQLQIKPVGRGTKTVAPTSLNADFVRKAKVRVSPALRAEGDRPALADFEKSDPPVPPSPTPDVKPSTFFSITLAGLSAPATNSSVSLASLEKKTEGTARREVPTRGAEANQTPGAASALGDSSDVAGVNEGGGGSSPAVEDSELSKEEEHNYSLFLTRSRAHAQLEEDDDKDEEEEEEEEAEDDEGDGLELDDEDHDEGFGSEHELSENDDDEEEEEDEDYEADKDDDMSDAFSEPGTCCLHVYYTP